jgi:hypothetical protein
VSREFENYKAAAMQGLHVRIVDPQTEWQHLYDWYEGEGRQQFMDAFTRETSLRFGQTLAPDDLVSAAIPKSYGDLERKARSNAFYRAHAVWVLEEMDHIVSSVPRDAANLIEAQSFADVLRFARIVLMDSVFLFEDWGTYRMGVPGVYGIGKNQAEHIMAFCQGARQTIYGHGSWGLSFVENHADLATATIRQAIEIRLRRAFGVMAKIRKIDDSIHPVPLTDLLEAIDAHKNNVSFPIRFENIMRINGWADMYLHGALKLYAWCPPRVLLFLREFLLGGRAPCVALDQATFDAIRSLIRRKHEGPDFELPLPRPYGGDAPLIR